MSFIKNYAIQYAWGLLSLLLLLTIVGIKLSLKKIYIPVIILFCFVFYFFRVPDKKHYNDKRFVFAPSYGKVLSVDITPQHYIIKTFIALTDPHIQYVPYPGILKQMDYLPGKFNPAFLIKKGDDNEQMSYTFLTDRGEIIVKQIAGVLARTIINFINPQANVVQGDEIGLIKFGSRCEIRVPRGNNLKVLVQVGDYLEGSKTPIIQFL